MNNSIPIVYKNTSICIMNARVLQLQVGQSIVPATFNELSEGFSVEFDVGLYNVIISVIAGRPPSITHISVLVSILGYTHTASCHVCDGIMFDLCHGEPIINDVFDDVYEVVFNTDYIYSIIDAVLMATHVATWTWLPEGTS